MRGILPIKYRYNCNSIFSGFIMLVIPFLLMYIPKIIKITNIDEVPSIMYIANWVIAAVGIGIISKELIYNINVMKRRKWRNYMLKNNYVKGEIKDIEENVVKIFNKKPGAERYSDNIYIYYSLVVEYIDPTTNLPRTIKSDPYREILKDYIENNQVNVYIDKNGDTLINDLNIRKSMSSNRININNKNNTDNDYNISDNSSFISNIGFIISKYERLISLFSIIVVIIIVLFIIFRAM